MKNKDLFNEPILSLNDLLSVWSENNQIEFYKASPLFQNFENLAKSKLGIKPELEVKEFLIKKAKKRYRIGNYIKDNWSNGYRMLDQLDRFDFSYNSLFVLNQNNSKACLFNNGEWAEIIQTMTKKEAEEKLNCKII